MPVFAEKSIWQPCGFNPSSDAKMANIGVGAIWRKNYICIISIIQIAPTPAAVKGFLKPPLVHMKRVFIFEPLIEPSRRRKMNVG